jgi:acetyltransferase-like isoleucine patch superfamily enzyme
VNLHRLRRVTPANVRRRLGDERRARKLAALTARVLTPPDPSAYKSFGTGSVIVPPSRVSMPEAIEIGDGVVVHEHAWLSVVAAVPGVTPRLRIGDRTSIGRFSHIACVGEIDIGPEVLTSERIFIGDTYHGYEDVGTPILDQPMAAPAKVTIERGAFLGIGCVVLRGVTIGEQAYVAAGAVVTADVEPRTVVVGNPARVVRAYDPATGRWET